MMDVGSVALDSRSTGVDVATQAAEGVGRSAAAYAGGAMGAKTGAALGSFAGPLGTGIGAGLGGIVGGLGGYFAADKGIPALRDRFGITPESPIDRTTARQTAALNAPTPATPPGGGHGAADPYAAATGAQRLASAWSMVSANAGVTDNTNLNISV